MRCCPQCSSNVPDGRACPTCGGTLSRPGRSVGPMILKLFGCLGILVVAFVIVVPGFFASSRASNDRNAAATLKSLTSAEADFRANDRDGNGVADFWTGDVAGLYCIAPGPGKPDPVNAIKLIEISMAGADSHPLTGVTRPPYVPLDTFVESRPKAGYWYWALRADARETPPELYRQEPGDQPPPGRYYHRNRFGVIAYPDTLSAGKVAFIVNEENRLLKRILHSALRPGPRVPPGPLTDPQFMDWPSEAVRTRDWARLD